MNKLDYPFYINHKILVEVSEIAKAGICSQNFLEDLDNLVKDAELRPNKDLHWDLSRLLSLYYAPELIPSDKTLAKMHNYLLNLWRQSLGVDEAGNEIKK